MTRTLVISLGLAFALLVLAGLCLRVGLGYLFAWWSDRAEDQQQAERARFQQIMQANSESRIWPAPSGPKGFENDCRHRRKSA